MEVCEEIIHLLGGMVACECVLAHILLLIGARFLPTYIVGELAGPHSPQAVVAARVRL